MFIVSFYSSFYYIILFVLLLSFIFLYCEVRQMLYSNVYHPTTPPPHNPTTAFCCTCSLKLTNVFRYSRLNLLHCFDVGWSLYLLRYCSLHAFIQSSYSVKLCTKLNRYSILTPHSSYVTHYIWLLATPNQWQHG